MSDLLSMQQIEQNIKNEQLNRVKSILDNFIQPEQEKVEKSEDINPIIKDKPVNDEIKKAFDVLSSKYEDNALMKSDLTKEQQAKVKKVMDEWKSGSLKSSSGEKVVDREQAIAIALSEAGVSKK